MSRADDADVTRDRNAIDDALGGWLPPTGLDPAVTRAQTRRAAEYLATTDARLGRTELLDALADGTTLSRSDLWGRAVDPGLRRLADTDLVEYDALAHTYRWVGEEEP